MLLSSRMTYDSRKSAVPQCPYLQGVIGLKPEAGVGILRCRVWSFGNWRLGVGLGLVASRVECFQSGIKGFWMQELT